MPTAGLAESGGACAVFPSSSIDLASGGPRRQGRLLKLLREARVHGNLAGPVYSCGFLWARRQLLSVQTLCDSYLMMTILTFCAYVLDFGPAWPRGARFQAVPKPRGRRGVGTAGRPGWLLSGVGKDGNILWRRRGNGCGGEEHAGGLPRPRIQFSGPGNEGQWGQGGRTAANSGGEHIHMPSASRVGAGSR